MPYWCLLFRSKWQHIAVNANAAHSTSSRIHNSKAATARLCRVPAFRQLVYSAAVVCIAHKTYITQCVRRTAATHHKRYHLTDAIIRYCSPHIYLFIIIDMDLFSVLSQRCAPIASFFIILWAISAYIPYIENDKLGSRVLFWCSKTKKSNVSIWFDSLNSRAQRSSRQKCQFPIPMDWRPHSCLPYHHHQSPGHDHCHHCYFFDFVRDRRIIRRR